MKSIAHTITLLIHNILFDVKKLSFKLSLCSLSFALIHKIPSITNDNNVYCHFMTYKMEHVHPVPFYYYPKVGTYLIQTHMPTLPFFSYFPRGLSALSVCYCDITHTRSNTFVKRFITWPATLHFIKKQCYIFH